MIRSSIAGLAINLIGAPMFSRPNLPAYMALFFMVTSPATSVAAEGTAPSTPSFQRVDYPTVPAPQAMAIADFNGDGLPDIAIASCIPPGSVSVLLNKGDGSFVPLEVALIPSDRIEGAEQREQPAGGSTKSNLCGLTTGDFDGDRVPDLALANADGTVSILLGKSGGTFGPKTNFPAGASASCIITADVNGDGALDLMVVNPLSNTISVLIGNGHGTFGRPVRFASGEAISGIS